VIPKRLCHAGLTSIKPGKRLSNGVSYITYGLGIHRVFFVKRFVYDSFKICGAHDLGLLWVKNVPENKQL